METGAIMAVTTHGGAVADTESIGETVAEAGVAVAEQAVQRAVNQARIEEVVADKGYHSNEVMRKLAEWKLRSYVAEPERGARKWKGKAAEQAAVYANRRRIPEREASVCKPGEGNGWRETLRISSISEAWIVCMFEVFTTCTRSY
jgi:hypothetical protein